jgi:hypothetical protein
VLPHSTSAQAQATAVMAALALAAFAGALFGWWGARSTARDRGEPDALA